MTNNFHEKVEGQAETYWNTELTVLAHELRNPLNVIMMAAEMLARKDSADLNFVHRQAEIIKQSALEMKSLIQGMGELKRTGN